MRLLMRRKTRAAKIPATAKMSDLTSILLKPKMRPRLINPQTGSFFDDVELVKLWLLVKLRSESFQASLRVR